MLANVSATSPAEHKKFLDQAGIEPGPSGWKTQALPLCYSVSLITMAQIQHL